MKYELYVYANWGMSRPDRIECETEDELIARFNDTPLGGKGCVQAVYAKKDGTTIAIKRFQYEH